MSATTVSPEMWEVMNQKFTLTSDPGAPEEEAVERVNKMLLKCRIRHIGSLIRHGSVNVLVLVGVQFFNAICLQLEQMGLWWDTDVSWWSPPN